MMDALAETAHQLASRTDQEVPSKRIKVSYISLNLQCMTNPKSPVCAGRHKTQKEPKNLPPPSLLFFFGIIINNVSLLLQVQWSVLSCKAKYVGKGPHSDFTIDAKIASGFKDVDWMIACSLF